MIPDEKNQFIEELKKNVRKEVTVESYKPNGDLLETKGQLRAISFNYLHCVIMTTKEKVLVKNFFRIRRLRPNHSSK